MHGCEGTERRCAWGRSARCSWSCSVCTTRVRTRGNGTRFRAIAASFLTLPNAKLGACSIFGNFCVGASKGVKRIPLAVRWGHNEEFYLWSLRKHFGRVRCYRFNIQMPALWIRNMSRFFFSGLVEKFLLECLILLTIWSIKIWKLIPKIPQLQVSSCIWKSRIVTAQAWRVSLWGTDNELQRVSFFSTSFFSVNLGFSSSSGLAFLFKALGL